MFDCLSPSLIICEMSSDVKYTYYTTTKDQGYKTTQSNITNTLTVAFSDIYSDRVQCITCKKAWKADVCNQIGHSQRDCPTRVAGLQFKAAGVQDRNVTGSDTYVSVKMQFGAKACEVKLNRLLDTGCDRNISPSDHSVYVANGSEIKSDGSIRLPVISTPKALRQFPRNRQNWWNHFGLWILKKTLGHLIIVTGSPFMINVYWSNKQWHLVSHINVRHIYIKFSITVPVESWKLE